MHAVDKYQMPGWAHRLRLLALKSSQAGKTGAKTGNPGRAGLALPAKQACQTALDIGGIDQLVMAYLSLPSCS